LSSTGAIGVMQLQPATTAWLETEVFGHELNESESIYDNVKGGIRLYRILLDETGDQELAIMAYY
jgi:soluble lytic murein transglycosylase-like protein